MVSVFYKLFHWQIKDELRQGLGAGGAGEAVERKREGKGQIQQGCGFLDGRYFRLIQGMVSQKDETPKTAGIKSGWQLLSGQGLDKSL